MAKCAVLVLSHIQLFAILWTVARQVPWDFPGKVLDWVAIAFSNDTIF